MKGYDYPRVRPPTSLYPPQQPADTRFSWMDTSGEQEDRVGETRQPSPPRFQQPTIQENPPEEQEQVHVQVPVQVHVQMPTMEPYGYAGGPVPYQVQDPMVTQLQYTQPPHHQGAYPTQSHIPTQTHTPQPWTYPPQHAMPPPPRPPEPVKQPIIPEYEATGLVGPDTNPLTDIVLKRPNRTSTNMAIVPPAPSDASHFSASTFTPSPQTIRGGSWQHGLCSCGDPSICVTALFCPCVIYGKTQYRLALRAEKKDPTNMLGYTPLNGSCIAFGVLCGFNGILAAIQHSRIRKTFGMSTEAGNVAGDCLKGVCCCCCIVAQDEKELKFREDHARNPSGSITKREGYIAPTSMAFSPPPR